MSFYELPKFNIPKIKTPKLFKNKIFWGFLLAVFASVVFGFLLGLISIDYFYQEVKGIFQKLDIFFSKTIEKEKIVEKEYISEVPYEQAIISAVKEASPSVVSIIVTKELPIIEEYWISPFKEFFGPEFDIPQYRQKGTEKQEIGGGTGFIVSEDGFILTNKHVVEDKDADYTVLTNDGQKFSAKVLARDPIQDLAIIKVESAKKFKPIKLGDSSGLEIGQTVIAIGNALGEFRNTVSVGVISGLGRTITASSEGGLTETLEDIIQTDAAINKGNSGGPLLNLKGEVIGVNTAMAQAAENIGFAVPINKAKKDIEQVIKTNKIVYPFLGVRYVLINEQIKEKNDLAVDYGAWIIEGEEGEPAITPGSAAEKAGLKENDIILEFNNEKITQDNSLAKIIVKYNPGDKIVLKILRNNQEEIIEATLGERSE